MNIDLINNQNVNRSMDVDNNQIGKLSMTGSRMNTSQIGYSLDITGKVMENAAYGKEDLKSAQEIAQAAGMIDMKLQRNYMAVMSNSMSSEDFGNLIKDGVNPTKTSVEETVTNLDKIKIRMAEAGITIEGFNDDISSEEAIAVVGNAYQASAISNNNIENVDEVSEALNIAKELEPITDEACQYMIMNNLEPTIENIYKAEHSSSLDNRKVSAGVSYSGVATYANTTSTQNAWSELENQAKEIVESSPVVDKEEGLLNAKWMVEHQVPLTKENLIKYTDLKDITLPLPEEDYLKAIETAIEEGVSPKEANLSNIESLYDRAVKIKIDFDNIDDGGDIHRRRLLEEVRLAMTEEANLTLLRKGIQIETTPLQELVDLLKEAEKEFYRPVLESNKSDFSGNENNTSENTADRRVDLSRSLEEKIDIYKSTQAVIKAIPQVPLKTIADVVLDNNDDNDFTLNNISVKGQVNKSVYEKAGESYEALMTAPRADMGDSIRKAFANVDEILSDLDFDLNDVNRKAVRTLGYANMPITKESIENVREATATVTRVLELMTPAKTMQMIKDGHNPLNENLEDLEKELSKENREEVTEKYSQYLWKLEKSGEVTVEEKDAYIGMYRLFNLIEKQDGKVIGNVLANGQELTMQNMLSASRSNRHKNMDVVINDDFGVLEDLVTKGDSITDQISRVFTQIMVEPVRKDYIEEKLSDVRKAAKEIDGVEGILNFLNEPVSVENIIAVNDMLFMGNGNSKKLFGQNQNSNKDEESEDTNQYITDDDVSELISDFTDRAGAEKSYAKYVQKAMEVVNEQLKNADTYIDVKQLSLLHKQLGFASKMSKSQTYDVPVKTEDGYTSIHLTIKHNGEEAGKVTASFDSSEYGRVNATFSLDANGLDGFIVSDSRAGVEELKRIQNDFEANLLRQNIKTKNLSFVYGKNKAETINTEVSEVSNRQLYSVAKAFIVAIGRN